MQATLAPPPRLRGSIASNPHFFVCFTSNLQRNIQIQVSAYFLIYLIVHQSQLCASQRFDFDVVVEGCKNWILEFDARKLFLMLHFAVGHKLFIFCSRALKGHSCTDWKFKIYLMQKFYVKSIIVSKTTILTVEFLKGLNSIFG